MNPVRPGLRGPGLWRVLVLRGAVLVVVHAGGASLLDAAATGLSTATLTD